MKALQIGHTLHWGATELSSLVKEKLILTI